MIIRAPHNQQNPFFQLLRSTAQDTNLSARALGVLAYLLSKPDSWEPSVDDICRRFKDVGRSQAYHIINEIFIPHRYASRTEERDKGRFVRWITSVYETPYAENQQLVEPDASQPDAANQEVAPDVDLPDVVEPEVAEPDVVNQHQYKTDKYIIQRRDITERNKDMSGTPDGTASSPEVQEIFQYWQSRLNHPKAKFSQDRQKKIKARLKDKFSVEDIKQAIDGCASSPYHMGQNDQGTVWDDIELICRDVKHVEMFIAKVNGRTGNGALAQFSPAAQQTIAALDGFVKRHMAKEKI